MPYKIFGRRLASGNIQIAIELPNGVHKYAETLKTLGPTTCVTRPKKDKPKPATMWAETPGPVIGVGEDGRPFYYEKLEE